MRAAFARQAALRRKKGPRTCFPQSRVAITSFASRCSYSSSKVKSGGRQSGAVRKRISDALRLGNDSGSILSSALIGAAATAAASRFQNIAAASSGEEEEVERIVQNEPKSHKEIIMKFIVDYIREADMGTFSKAPVESAKVLVGRVIADVDRNYHDAHASAAETANEFVRSREAMLEISRLLNELYVERRNALIENNDESEKQERTRLQLSDIALGLQILSASSKRNDWNAHPVHSPTLKTFSEYLDLCISLYDMRSMQEFTKKLETQLGDRAPQFELLSNEIQPVFKSTQDRPAHVLLRDKKQKRLILVVRGTDEVHDILTDMKLDPVPFENGFAHQGIAKSAETLHEELAGSLLRVSQAYPKDELVITGHSLGGGTATLLALLLRRRSGINASCVGFAAPSCVSNSILNELQASSWCRNAAMEKDIVVRFSEAGLLDLLDTILDLAQHEKEKRFAEINAKADELVHEVEKMTEEYAESWKPSVTPSASDYYLSITSDMKREMYAEILSHSRLLQKTLKRTVRDRLEQLRGLIITPRPSLQSANDMRPRLYSPSSYVIVDEIIDDDSQRCRTIVVPCDAANLASVLVHPTALSSHLAASYKSALDHAALCSSVDTS